jgi:hypothetical protein
VQNFMELTCEKIKSLFFKSFEIVYECMKCMVKEWYDIIIIHKSHIMISAYFCKLKNINFHSYAINIRSFSPILTCGLDTKQPMQNQL